MSNVDVTRDAPRAPQAPIDPDVKLPDSVRRAAAAADAYYAQQTPAAAPADAPASGETINIVEAAPSPVRATPAPVQPQEPIEPPAPVAAAPAEPPVQPAPPQAAHPAEPPVTEEQWEHRYRSMKGRHDSAQQIIGSMQEQMAQMGDELLRTQQLLMQQNPNARPHANQPQQPQRLITPEDEQNYGNDLIDLARRAGREAVAGELDEVKQANQRLQQQVQRDAQGRVLEALTQAVPNWREINRDPRFISWLRLPDIYSGVIRKQLLDDAFRAASVPRVVSFFKGFVSDEALTGNIDPSPQTEQPPAPRTPAVPLERLAAPGRARPAGGETPTSSLDKPIFSKNQIKDFYARVRAGHYVGRDADKQRDEAAIFAAQAEGRIR